jgi:transposase
MAFDQYGFQYWHEVRPGNTYTSNGSPEIIYEIFKRVKNKHLYFLGDSGFCNNAVFTACHQQNADFVIAGRANMYGRFLGFIKEWKSSQIKFHDGRKTEIGHTFYITSESKKDLSPDCAENQG